MFEHLQIHQRIAVTGPQRAGTTIAGRMIAHDTGHRYVDEAEFSVYDVETWRGILAGTRIVVQCPHMFKVLVDESPPDVFVIMMRRDLAAIHASEHRIQWEETMRGNTRELARFGLTQGDSALLKYKYWEAHPRPAQFLELRYELLAEHPLYIGNDQRARFERKQTAPSHRLDLP